MSNTTNRLKKTGSIDDFLFTPGDELMIIAYYDTLESGILDAPVSGKDYVFQFAFNITCPEIPTEIYEGVVYNPVQIFSHCWLKENLNIGVMVSGAGNQVDNGLQEKYCYNNNPANCDQYGGLYQRDKMMQYTTQPGSRAICPEFWHIPLDEEWKILDAAVDSQYPISDPVWDEIYYRGYDTGKNLKSDYGWNNNANGTDLFGFQGLPGGIRLYDGTFNSLVFRGYWGSSNEANSTEVWRHYLSFNFDTA